jgi:hypothetical protein
MNAINFRCASSACGRRRRLRCIGHIFLRAIFQLSGAKESERTQHKAACSAGQVKRWLDLPCRGMPGDVTSRRAALTSPSLYEIIHAHTHKHIQEPRRSESLPPPPPSSDLPAAKTQRRRFVCCNDVGETRQTSYFTVAV